MAGPLEGVRVVERAMFHSGPAAGYMLGDLGAEVIKIEQPVSGVPLGVIGSSKLPYDDGVPPSNSVRRRPMTLIAPS